MRTRNGRRPPDPRADALRDVYRSGSRMSDGDDPQYPDVDEAAIRAMYPGSASYRDPDMDPQLEALESLAAGEMDEDPSDYMDDPAGDSMGYDPPRPDVGAAAARSLPAYSSYEGHSGPAMQRYLDLDRALEGQAIRDERDVYSPEETEATGLPDQYEAARREAALKGINLQRLFGR